MASQPWLGRQSSFASVAPTPTKLKLPPLSKPITLPKIPLNYYTEPALPVIVELFLNISIRDTILARPVRLTPSPNTSL